MKYVHELPINIQELLLTILEKHLIANEFETSFELERDDLLNSKIEDIDDFLNLVDHLEF